jgi:LAO/AO transport system kinase
MPPILRTVAVRGDGIAELLDAVEAHQSEHGHGAAAPRLQVRARRWIVELAAGRLRDVLTASGGPLHVRLEALAGQVADRTIDPVTAAERLLEELG